MILILMILVHLARSETHRIKNDATLVRTNDNIQPLYECNVKDHPYFISLQLGAISNVHCAGSLIGPTLVLTAAHCCVLYQTDLVIALSGYGYHPGRYSQKAYVKGTYIHPSYKAWEPEKGNDICLIRLNESISEDSYTKYVEIADPSFIEDLDRTKHVVRIMGFKWDSEDKQEDNSFMHCSSLSVALWKECKKKIPTAVRPFNFCLRNDNSTRMCHIDEGGPVMYKGLQVGIVSFSPNFVPDCTSKAYLLAHKIKEQTISFVRELDANYTVRSSTRGSNTGSIPIISRILIIYSIAFPII